MKKNYFYIFVFIFLTILLFFIFYNSLKITYYEKGEKENAFNSYLKKIVPQNIKDFTKETIFVFKKKELLEKKIADIKKEYSEFIKKTEEDILYLEKENIQLNQIIKEQSKFILNLQLNENKENVFSFFKNLETTEFLNKSKLIFKRFTMPFLTDLGPRSYFGHDSENLYLITGTGLLIYNSLQNLQNDNFVFTKIDTNFNDIVDEVHNETKHVVKNILIKKNKIYLSYVKKVKEDCYSNAILVSKINTKEIFFEEFFNTNNCQPVFNEQSGGALADFKENKIIMTLGDYGSYENPDQGNDNPQNKEKLIGKIISIDEKTKNYKILSMGHRNPQGLFYDKKNNLIFNAEHGPMGGDEININTSPDENIKNYGWGISSYGEHYGFPSDDHVTLKKYKLAPLHKSHADFGFFEPLKYFTPSIGPSQIIKTEEFIKIKDAHVLYLAAMGNKVDEGDLSIHQFVLNKNFKIEEHNILRVHERVRDILYIEKLDKIFVFLETTGSIGVLELIE